MNKWGIRARVLFLALLPSIMILLTLVGFFTYTRIAEVDVLLAQRGISLARQLAPGTEFALFAGDTAALERLAHAAAREEDVANVTITDAHGRVVANAASLVPAAGDAAARFTQPVMATRLDAADFAEQIAPSSAPTKIGEITVAMSRTGAQAHQQELLLTGLGLGSACVIIAVALALSIGNSVIYPIRRLAAAMAELSQGKQVAPLSTTGGGEFRTLNDGFNEMAARLQAGTRELEARINDATRALIAQKDTAEQATKAKSRFIAAASHDLRQPLHAIGLFSATLQRRTEGTELQAVVRDLAKAVFVMDRLFDSLLDISRLDAGTLQADPRPFPLERVFVQLAAEYSDAAEQKHLRLHVSPTTAIVVTDELLLYRILTNLVANAIRYTSLGTVMVCGRRRDGDVEIEVRDSGIGIPEDKQDDIFQEFFQITNAARDRGVGLGLGLAIVSRLARLLATEVKVRSASGRGSVFSVRVPRGELYAVPTLQVPAQAAAWPAGVLLPVLVIDDDPLVLAGNRVLLEELGCDVTTVSDDRSAQAALAAFGDKAILVLCDLWLSDDRNGIDLLRRLSTLTTAPISGVLISGDTRPETIVAAKVAGYPLLHKPVSPAKLRAVVMHFAWKMRGITAPKAADEDTSC